jgi:hypothetical protein
MALLHIRFYYILVISCLLTGCILFRKNWLLEYKLLVVLSGLTVLTEIIRQICSGLMIPGPGDWIYNFFLPVECAFFIYIFYRASKHPAIKQLDTVLLMLLPVGAGILYFIFPYFSSSNKPVALFYLFTELICAGSFVIDLLLTQSKTSLTRQPLFWVAFGLLFYSGMYIVLLGIITAVRMTKSLFIYELLNSLISNLFLYSGFIICFIRLHKAKPGVHPG